MQIFKGVASGKESFREHCATKWFLEAIPQNISASKISRYTVYRRQSGEVQRFQSSCASPMSRAEVTGHVIFPNIKVAPKISAVLFQSLEVLLFFTLFSSSFLSLTSMLYALAIYIMLLKWLSFNTDSQIQHIKQ